MDTKNIIAELEYYNYLKKNDDDYEKSTIKLNLKRMNLSGINVYYNMAENTWSVDSSSTPRSPRNCRHLILVTDDETSIPRDEICRGIKKYLDNQNDDNVVRTENNNFQVVSPGRGDIKEKRWSEFRHV